MGRGQKLVSDAFLVFVIGILANVIGYFIRMILSRQLTLQEFGIFYSVFTFILFFSMFRDFGLSQSLSKFIPQFLVRREFGKLKYSIKFVFLVNLIVSSIILVILLFLSDFLSVNYFKNELAKPLLIILGIYFVLHSIYTVFISIFIGFQKSKLYSLDLFLVNLFVFLGLFIFSSLGVFSPAVSYLLATIVGIIIYSFLLFRFINFIKNKERISGRLKFDLLKYGFPLMFATIGFMIIAQLDTLILIYFRTIEEVGIYNVVLPTAMLLITLGSSLALAMLPLISEVWSSKKYNEAKNLIKNVYQKAFILIVPAGFVLLSFSEFILDVLFGSKFIVGSTALKVLSIGGIFFSFAVVNNNILAATGNPKKVTITILVAALINLILNFALIPYYGIVGSALATTFSYLFVLILSTYFTVKVIGMKIPFLDWGKILFSGIIFILSIDFFRNLIQLNIWLETFVVLLLSLTVYFLLLIVFGIKLYVNRKIY
jgi:O-antigen/teichoic acid export membrane protein